MNAKRRKLLQDLIGYALDQAHDAPDYDYLAETFDTTADELLAVAHELAHGYTVPLPWDLTPDQLDDELRAFGDVDDLNDEPEALTPLGVAARVHWLTETGAGRDEGDAELRRVFLAAGLLGARYPARPFSECLRQSTIWERG